MEVAIAIGDEGGIAIAVGEKEDDMDVPPMVMTS